MSAERKPTKKPVRNAPLHRAAFESYNWLKLPAGLLLDPTFMRMHPDLQATLLKLAMLVVQERTFLDGTLPSPDQAGWHLRVDPEDLQGVMVKLADLGFLSQRGDKWYHSAFLRWQEPKSGRERIREYRERAKAPPVTQRYAPRNTALPESDREEESDRLLLQHLTDFGVNRPEGLLQKHDHKRIQDAIDHCRAARKEAPALLAILRDGQPVPFRDLDPDRASVRARYAAPSGVADDDPAPGEEGDA
jgi:hypothetical protein